MSRKKFKKEVVATTIDTSKNVSIQHLNMWDQIKTAIDFLFLKREDLAVKKAKAVNEEYLVRRANCSSFVKRTLSEMRNKEMVGVDFEVPSKWRDVLHSILSEEWITKYYRVEINDFRTQFNQEVTISVRLGVLDWEE